MVRLMGATMGTPLKKTFVTLMLAAFPFSGANAQQVVAQCGASKGQTVFLNSSKLVWENDGITNGSLTFIKLKNGKFDIITKDAMKSFSYTDDGASIVTLEEGDNKKTLVVMHSNTVIEVFQLTLEKNGSGVLIWTATKNGAPNSLVTKGSLFTAICSPTR